MEKRLVSIAQARNQLCAVLKQAQTGHIVVTRHGRPVAIIVGIEGTSLEELVNQGTDAILQTALAKGPPAPPATSDPPEDR